MGKIPFLYRMIRGAVGRRLVVKHYRGGRVVVSRFPDMSGVVATARQRVRRDLFREAVGFAKWVIGEEGRKVAFRQMLPRKKRRKVYQAALQLYLQHKGSRQWVGKVVTVVNGEGSKVNGVYEQLEPWRVVWEKGASEGEGRRVARGGWAVAASGRGGGLVVLRE